jgi:hypothetical protein
MLRKFVTETKQLGQHRHKKKKGKKRNLKGLDVVTNCKEVCFQGRDPPFALFCGIKKLAHDHKA